MIEKLQEHEGFTDLAFFQEALAEGRESLVKELVGLAPEPFHLYLTQEEEWAEVIFNYADSNNPQTDESLANVVYEWACEQLGVTPDRDLNF